MDTSAALQEIARRLREIDTDSPADAERFIQRFTGDACLQMQPHWQTIVARAGVVSGMSPFPTDEHLDSFSKQEAWAIAWHGVAPVVRFAIHKDFLPGMPERTEHRQEPGLSVSIITYNATDWRERANDYAEICDAVAGWLSDSPDAGITVEAEPAGQRQRRTKPRMNVSKVQEHWQTVLDSGNNLLIQDYLTLAETKLAARIGCCRNTLRNCEGFKNRRIALHKFNRENG